MRHPFPLVALSLMSLCVVAQQATIVHTGPSQFTPIRVAPGQIVHLRLQNIRTVFNSTQVAERVPLPTQFGQMSVVLTQTGAAPVAIPLVRGDLLGHGCEMIAPIPSDAPGGAVPCPPGDSVGYDLMVQIPFELKPNPPGPFQSTNLPQFSDATLTLRELGRDAGTIRILPVEDRIQLLAQCWGMPYRDAACSAQMYHSDGKVVDAANPARSGEEVILYAYGLGMPDTPVPSGTATPSVGIPVSRPIRIFFPGTGQPESRPRYVGLTSGQVGLYQINIMVPPLPAETPLCSEALTANLSVVVRGTASSDQISFCARP